MERKQKDGLMAFNINSFQAEMTKNGLAKTSNFEVEISGAPVNANGPGLTIGGLLSNPAGVVTDIVGDFVGSLLGTGSSEARSMSFRIESVTMPQRALGRIDYKDYGIPYNIPSLANYVDINFSVILSPDLREREFFMAWQDNATGSHRTEKGVGPNQMDVGYYDNVVLQQGFSIYQLNDNGQRTHRIDLIDCYPALVGPINANWATTEVQRIEVVMGYRYFKEETLPLGFTFDLDNIASTVNSIKNLPGQIKNRSADAATRAGIPIRQIF